MRGLLVIVRPGENRGPRMSRILMVAFRPHAGQREALLSLLHFQHMHVRGLGFIAKRQPWLMEAANGEIVYVAGFDDCGQVDLCWEDETFQDINSQISDIADMVPLRSLHEASAAYVDMEALEPVGA
ncbi:hypothetical protein KPL74_20930 [Bacillus sp. NP157]|nr:hypothetical protein KPL74_20930 [Bacillus sp. NP157]